MHVTSKPVSLIYSFLIIYYSFFPFTLDFYWYSGIKEDKTINTNKLSKKNTGTNTGILPKIPEFTGTTLI